MIMQLINDNIHILPKYKSIQGFTVYSKTCLMRPLKNRHTKSFKTNGSLIKVESIAECSLGAFCNTFDMH